MATERTDGDALIEVENVSKWFDMTPGVVDRLFRREPQPVKAVDGVSFTIEEGDVMGVAGESGCGKTTLGKLLVKLYEPTDGTIRFDGRDITEIDEETEQEFRKRVQMIFQDPFESLNPRMTVFQTVVEPLKINDIGSGYQDRRDRVIDVLNDVGLAPAEAYLNEFPQELSGGERQRVAIARALVVDPDFIVADEPVSMLDVSIRAGVLNLMKRLQDEYGLTYLFISHDLSLIRYMCDKTAIMYLGNIIEQGRTEDIIESSKHPYTEALFDAVPDINLSEDKRRANVAGEVPNPRNPPSGCRFHPRCANIIPPDDWGSDQDAFRRAFQFKRRTVTGELDLEKAGVDPETMSREEQVRQLMSYGLRLEVPEEHRIEGETSQGVNLEQVELPAETENLIREATEDLLQEEPERAAERFEGQLRTICETERPALREVDDQIVACHLYEATGTQDEPAPTVTTD